MPPRPPGASLLPPPRAAALPLPAPPADRAHVLDHLHDALARGSCVAVLFLDVDQFKLVNDARGHAVGDQVLVEVGRRLAAAVRPADAVARFGGDEFVVVCEGLAEPEALALADVVLAALAPPLVLAGGHVPVGASIGVAVSSSGTADDLLRHADTAVHAAKAAGRGRAHLFEPGLAEAVDRQYALSRDLREALAQDALALHHQPIVDLTSGRVLGVEALVRWQHPEHGAVPASLLVGVAEATGLAPALDRWVLRRALQDAERMLAAGALVRDASVSINLSSVADAPLDDLESWTAAAGLEPGQVVLEITGSAVVQDTRGAVRVLQRLRDRGYGIAIDDFGTGYGSLAHLRALPVTALKVDRSFVADIATDRHALAVVASVVDLARAVGVTVVAQGVESLDQVALLQGLGCDAAQGWLWSRALPVHEVVESRAWTRRLDVPARGRSRVRAAQRSAAARSSRVHEENGLHRLLELHQDSASPATIASALNAEGFRTPSGTRWHPSTVARTLERLVPSPRRGDQG